MMNHTFVSLVLAFVIPVRLASARRALWFKDLYLTTKGSKDITKEHEGLFQQNQKSNIFKYSTPVSSCPHVYR